MKTGLLLINLGTPKSPTTKEVRTYLAEFLSDPRVIDIHPIARWLLLHGIILRTRPKKSAEAYRQVWTDRGSPLLFHTQDLAKKVGAILGDSWTVTACMRYGQPSIQSAFDALLAKDVDRIVVLPLFPHYAASSTGSAVEEVYRVANTQWNIPPISVCGSFYQAPGFVKAFAEVGQKTLQANNWDHVLFSFHGLPERHIKKSDPTHQHCLATAQCCDNITSANRYCYRAQTVATARLLAHKLGIQKEQYTICFQSRLGRTPWITPYTDKVIDDLAASGKKNLVVFCPAFVADCLETLEEIGLRAKEQFVAAGGDNLVLVPSLNATDTWAQAVADMATEQQTTRRDKKTDANKGPSLPVVSSSSSSFIQG